MISERQPYRFSELFTGNWDLFQKAVQNPETIFVYDNDGIISDTSKIVLKRFNEKYGTSAKLADISCWSYVVEVAKNAGFSEDIICNAERDYYDPKVLEMAQTNLYMKSVIMKTLAYYGPDKNYILTSRNPDLKDSTLSWFKRKFPDILPGNILIRDGKNKISGENFKIVELRKLAIKSPWVIFIDDGLSFVKSTLEADIGNCLIINCPQGKIVPDFTHDRLFVVKRFPDEIQAMYPLMDAIDRVFRNSTSP